MNFAPVDVPPQFRVRVSQTLQYPSGGENTVGRVDEPGHLLHEMHVVLALRTRSDTDTTFTVHARRASYSAEELDGQHTLLSEITGYASIPNA